MPRQELNTGIIFTNSNCIGCNKCISGCISVGANVVIKEETSNQYVVMVNPNKCVLCGTCVAACVHEARTYRDDTDEFFNALERGENISLLVAPTLLTDYEKRYHNILGFLKHKGVNHIYNTGFGGDLMVWVSMIFNKNFGLAGFISQCCPVIVNYLEKYRPELLPYLMPVQSPVMCTAIYVKDYLNIEDKLAYISPCIAGKYEIDDINTYGKVAYNVTFERLMKRIENIDISGYYAGDEASYGLGALISMPGGLSDNIERYIGFNEVLIQTGGPDNIFPYFDHYSNEVATHGELPFLVDALSCTNGCNFGTGTRCGVELRNEMTFSYHRVKEHAYRSGSASRAKSYEERLEMLDKRFEKFELSSFVRQYDATRSVKKILISEEKANEIFNSMYKYDEEQRLTDCGSCGYMTCRDMVNAIGADFNHKENCINYSKECIRLETEKTNRLLAEISKMNDELMQSTQLKSNFLANMSHEIRTPMNAIIGMAEMALRGELPGEERSYIQQIKTSGRSLLAIINDILDFSKIESGKMEINESEYEVMSIINDTVNIAMTRIGEKDITLIIEADPNIPNSLYGDDIRIKQVLVNLVTNAIKFTESGFVRIVLSHKRCDDMIWMTITVQDSGIGIKPEDLEKLFNSFQQVDSRRNRNVEGTGLGLVISREFVKLMNGNVHVDSEYGKGSTFSFTIPQKIVSDVKCILIKNKEQIKAAYLIQNKYVCEGFLIAAKQLHIETIECNSMKDMVAAADKGAAYFFVEYPLWEPVMEKFTEIYSDIQVAIIVDPRKEIVTANNVRKIAQPAYSLNIAAVINHETVELFDHQLHKKEFRYEAPEARILIVDDNAINLTVAKGLLSPLHMQITSASSAKDAFQRLDESEYDIIFMDHMMPEIDGVDATHMIRERGGEYYKNLPIIALTANATNNAKEMFINEGMNDFVSKPIEMVDITSKLRKWLPAEKIKSIGTSDENAVKQSETDGTENSMLQIEGLDVQAGLALSGTMELYKTILADYEAVIEKKAELIKSYLESSDIESYTIEVHALKSASKLIGAAQLSDLAAELEKHGHAGEWQPIQENTEELLRQYRAYIPILAPYQRMEYITEDTEVSTEQLGSQLTNICDALDDFDLDLAHDIMDKLKSFRLDNAEALMRDKLNEAVEEMEYDDAVEIAKEWKSMLK